MLHKMHVSLIGFISYCILAKTDKSDLVNPVAKAKLASSGVPLFFHTADCSCRSRCRKNRACKANPFDCMGGLCASLRGNRATGLFEPRLGDEFQPEEKPLGSGRRGLKAGR